MKIFYLYLAISFVFCKLEIEPYTTADTEFSKKYESEIGNLDLLFLVDNTGIIFPKYLIYKQGVWVMKLLKSC